MSVSKALDVLHADSAVFHILQKYSQCNHSEDEEIKHDTCMTFYEALNVKCSILAAHIPKTVERSLVESQHYA